MLLPMPMLMLTLMWNLRLLLQPEMLNTVSAGNETIQNPIK